MSELVSGYGGQLPLSIRLRESATFSNYVGSEKSALVSVLRQACLGGSERFVYFWGGSSLGKSHLLQAACHLAAEEGASCIYLPLKDIAQLDPQILDGIESMGIVALDDIDVIAGCKRWEAAVFHLYNRIRDEGEGALLVSGAAALVSSPLMLPDLRSRLAWGLVYQLEALNDEQKILALQQHAKARGLDLPSDVGHYLLRNYQRDFAALFVLLRRLDEASLVAQRKLTVPFVSGVIKSGKHFESSGP